MKGNEDVVKQKLRVKGMHCGSCAMSIDDELEELPGVDRSKTSYRKGTTEVAFDPSRVDLDVIRSTIRAIGYDVEPA